MSVRARTGDLFSSVYLMALVVSCGGENAQNTPAKTPAAPGASYDDKPIDARELGTVDPTACGTKGLIAQIGATCAGVVSRNARGVGGAQASTATDGDACTIWNSGGLPPQTIDLDLERETAVSGLLLVPDMTPPRGDVTHVIEQSDNGDSYRPVVTVHREMVGGHAYAVTFPKRVTAHYLRVTTMASPSWVAWAEVAPVLCQ